MKIGIDILYLLVCIPRPDKPLDVFKCKIGITGWHIGAKKRAKQVSDALPGIWIPIAFVVIPFAYQIEQAIHWLLHPINAPYKKGSGRTEVFWFPAHVLPLAVIVLAWMWEFQAAVWIWQAISNIT